MTISLLANCSKPFATWLLMSRSRDACCCWVNCRYANPAPINTAAPPISWPMVLQKLSSMSARAFGSAAVMDRICHFGTHHLAGWLDPEEEKHNGLKLEVTGEQPAPSGVIVRSQIIKGDGEPIKVDYMMRRNGDSWLISDIYLDGAISEVATRRSEFAAILKTEGIDGLIAALNR
jgi:hypothetical protein